MLVPFRYNPLISASFLVLALATAVPAHSAAPAECPQPRFTGKAPDEYLAKVNPITAANANVAAAEATFRGEAGPINCAICHGKKGDGRGTLSSQYDPPPRNFACAKTINGVPDGQLFWIIRFGSPGAAMPPHASMTDDQVWQMVHYLRQLAK